MIARPLVNIGLGAALLVAGCETPNGQSWVRHAPLQQATPSALPASRVSPATIVEDAPPPTQALEPEMGSPSDSPRVARAQLYGPPAPAQDVIVEDGSLSSQTDPREQVLSFISRLETAYPDSPRPPDAYPRESVRRGTADPPTQPGLAKPTARTDGPRQAPALIDEIDDRLAARSDSPRLPAEAIPQEDGRPRVLKVWADPVAPDRTSPDPVRNEIVKNATVDVDSDVQSAVADDTSSQSGATAELHTDAWRNALLQLAEGGDADEPPSGDVPEDLYQAAVRAVRATGEAMADPAMRANSALRAVETLRDELRTHADVEIIAVELCSAVRAFGVYDPLPDPAFRAYSRNQAIAYLAIRNFTSEQTADGRYRSLLGDRFEILTSDGEVVWTHSEPVIEDLSRQRREDFFIAQRLVIGTQLAQGSYVLKVTVEDKLAAKQTQHIHPFRVAPARTTSADR